MDLILFIILCGVVVFFFKKFSSFIYFVAIVDIFLRIVTYIRITYTKGSVYDFINSYIPVNIPAIMDKYADGLLLDVFICMYVLGFIILEWYLIKTFFRKK